MKIDSKRKEQLKKYAAAALALCVLAVFYLGSAKLLSSGAPRVLFNVSQSEPSGELSKTVASNSALAHPFFARAAIALASFRAPVKTGWYSIEKGDTFFSLLTKLSSGEQATSAFRIPEGFTSRQIFELLGKRDDLKHEAEDLSRDEAKAAGSESFQKILAFQNEIGEPAQNGKSREASIEGLLAPDTYFYIVGQTDTKLLLRSVNQQRKIINEEWEKRKPAVNDVLHSRYEALILASVIEKESGVKADKHLISSVFHNRLRIGMPLQSDPTVIYGMGERFQGNLTKADLRTPTPYNTYTMKGLPPTPICAPSRESINAALQPADTKYLYFVARGDGSSEFSDNLQSHNQAVDKYQRSGIKNGGSK